MMKSLSARIAAAVLAAVAMLTGVEGLSTKAYQDTGGVWTICYGQTGNVKAGQVKTKEQCFEMLQEEATRYAVWVDQQIPGLSPNRLAALTSFCYNVGRTNCATSTLFKLAKAGDYEAAGKQFARWNRVKGKVCTIRSNNCYGIVIRRQAEAALWSKPE